MPDLPSLAFRLLRERFFGYRDRRDLGDRPAPVLTDPFPIPARNLWTGPRGRFRLPFSLPAG